MKKYLLALLFLMLGGTLLACPPVVRFRSHYVAPVVVKKVIEAPVAVIAPVVPVVVPLYGASYNPLLAAPPVPAPAQPDPMKVIEELRKEIEALKARPQVLPQAQPEAKQGANWQGLLAAKCASCHTGDKAKGSFPIYDAPGVFSARFDDKAKVRAYKAIQRGQMPLGPDGKPHGVSDEEAAVAVDMLP